MQVHILTFGVLKDWLGSTTLDLPEGTRVTGLLAHLSGHLAPNGSRVPATIWASIAVSVNAEYALPAHILRDGDEVGLLPPVSGGLLADNTLVIALTRESIEADKLVASAKEGIDGAIVVFDGIVRNNTRGRRTLHLDYEAYEEMALRQMSDLATQAVERFGVRHITIIHRLGRLAVGETSVLIVVAAAHRAQAYEASRFLIDTLKKTVPIWKKETFVDGAVWSDGEPFPDDIAINPEAPRAS